MEEQQIKNKKSKKESRDFAIGVFYILVSSLGFAGNQALSSALGDSVGVFEKMVIHHFIGVLVIGFILWKQKISFFGTRKDYMFGRAFFGFISALFIISATTFSSRPLFEINILVSTSAIFTIIFAAILLKEKVDKYQYVVVMVCFVGVYLIVRPSAELLTDPYCLFAILGALFAGLAYTFVRRLKDYAHPYAVVFCYCAMSSFAVLPCYIWELANGAGLPTAREWLYLLGMGVGITTGQLFLNLAYRKAEASKLSPYTYSQNVYSLLITLFIFGQAIPVASYIGAVIIIGGNYVNFRLGQNAVKKAMLQKEAV